jgi:hypothetical protein
LLMNYVYAHPDSTMVFLPLGAISALINHSEQPNAKMVWSSHPSNNEEWFELSREQLFEPKNQYIGLLMEIVAIKDIPEGEEVFIDYGTKWQDAWDLHVLTWKELKKEGFIPDTWPMRALDLNQEHRDGTKPIATISEEENDPYPDHIITTCYFFIIETEDVGFLMGERGADNSTGEDPEMYVFSKPEEGSMYHDFNLVECHITERRKESDGSFVYTVLLEDEKLKVSTTINEVPHKSIFFADKPELSDQYHPDGFRHAVGIPDEIFPQGAWRDVDFIR